MTLVNVHLPDLEDFKADVLRQIAREEAGQVEKIYRKPEPLLTMKNLGLSLEPTPYKMALRD